VVDLRSVERFVGATARLPYWAALGARMDHEAVFEVRHGRARHRIAPPRARNFCFLLRAKPNKACALARSTGSSASTTVASIRLRRGQLERKQKLSSEISRFGEHKFCFEARLRFFFCRKKIGESKCQSRAARLSDPTSRT
jgi:hypothetical protein